MDGFRQVGFFVYRDAFICEKGKKNELAERLLSTSKNGPETSQINLKQDKA